MRFLLPFLASLLASSLFAANLSFLAPTNDVLPTNLGRFRASNVVAAVNVGIRTNAPSEVLEGLGGFKFRSPATASSAFYDHTNSRFHILTHSSKTGYIEVAELDNAFVRNRMGIDSIGPSTPHPLHLWANGSSRWVVGTDGTFRPEDHNASIIGSSVSPLSLVATGLFANLGMPALPVTNIYSETNIINKRVGIGTNNPSWPLHVRGPALFDVYGIRVPAGGASEPSVASAASTNMGMYFGGSSINFSIAGTAYQQLVANATRLLSDTGVYAAGAASDTFWAYVSPGVSAWGNGTAASPSTNWVRGSHTNASNQRGIQVVGLDSSLNAAVVRSVSVGANTKPDPLIMGVNAKQNLTLNTNGTASIRDGAILLAEGVVATVPGVDLNVTTKSTLFTVPAGITFIPTKIVVRNASTSLTTANFGFGFNANADDVVASATHTELTGSTLYTVVGAKVGAIRGAATDVFGLKCSVAQGGAATVDVDVFGFFQ